MATRLTGLLVGLACSLSVQSVQALNLLQCYELALQNDARYQTARAETAAARELVPMAFSQFLPNLSANLARNKSETDTITSNALIERRDNSSYLGGNYALTLRQPLYRKQVAAQYAQAGHQVDSAEAKLERSRQELILRTSGAYFDALLAQSQYDLAVAQKEANAAQLQAARRSFEHGEGTRTDIDDAQARLDMALAQELEARQNIGTTKRQLEIIVNRPVAELARLDPGRLPLVEPQPNDGAAWVANGEDNNPELRALRADMEAARQDIEKARAGHMPTVDLVAQRRKSVSDSETSINSRYLTSQIGVQVSVPLFAGGYVNAAVRQALANLEAVQQRYEVRRREIGADIQKEFQKVNEGILKVRALEQAERSARQSVYSNQKGFQAGTRTRIDILNAEQQYTNAQKELAGARYQYIQSRVRLLNLASVLDEQEVRQINAWLAP